MRRFHREEVDGINADGSNISLTQPAIGIIACRPLCSRIAIESDVIVYGTIVCRHKQKRYVVAGFVFVDMASCLSIVVADGKH